MFVQESKFDLIGLRVSLDETCLIKLILT